MTDFPPELVEKMARALHDAINKSLGGSLVAWDEQLPEFRESDCDNMRAALSSLSAEGWVVAPIDPTPEMVEAGRKAMAPETFVSHARVMWVWQAMTDVCAAPSAHKAADGV